MSTILIIIAAIVGVLLVLQVLFLLKAGQIWLALSLFFAQEDDETPSSFARMCQDLAKMTGQSIAMEVKTTLMGKESGQARLEKAIMQDVAQDQLANQNPGIAALLESFPSLKKRALKNPGIVDFILSRLDSGGGSTPESGDYGARLNKYR